MRPRRYKSTKQVDMQHSSAAAKLIRQMFRQDSHQNMQEKMQVRLHRMQLSLQFSCDMQRSEPSWALRDPLRAVLGARRPVWRLSWALRGPSRGHLERQEARPEAILGARRAVRRLSWTPEGPSAGCLGRQQARMQGFTAVLLQNAGFVQLAAGPAHKPEAQPLRCSRRIFV